MMNDDDYAYDSISFPALADVGEAFCRHGGLEDDHAARRDHGERVREASLAARRLHHQLGAGAQSVTARETVVSSPAWLRLKVTETVGVLSTMMCCGPRSMSFSTVIPAFVL